MVGNVYSAIMGIKIKIQIFIGDRLALWLELVPLKQSFVNGSTKTTSGWSVDLGFVLYTYRKHGNKRRGYGERKPPQHRPGTK